MKKNQMILDIARQIILEDVSDQLAFNIMNLKDPKKMWDILKNIWSEIRHGMVYFILQELLNYSRINKPKGYNKFVMQIFVEVQYFCKRLKTPMILGWNCWDNIAIVIALDSLYDNFNMTMASLLKIENRTVNQIQSIIQLKKAKNISKHITKAIKD